jgi:hypothetical protein
MAQARDLVAGAAPLVERLERDEILVGGDLEHAVPGRVQDGRPGPQVLGAQLLQDFRSRSGLVAQDLAADASLEGLHDLRREPFGVDAEGVFGDDARHLPVAGGGVLARAALGHLPEGAIGARATRAIERRSQVAEAEAGQIRNRHRPRRQDMAEGVASLVAEGGGVGRLANPEPIANDDDRAPEGAAHGPSIQRSAAAKASSGSANQMAVS